MTRPNLLAIGHYPDWDMEPMRQGYTLHHVASPTDIPAMPAHPREAITAVAYSGHVAFGGAEMDALPNLKLIANFGVGYDAIDTDAAKARGIAVTNTPDVLNDDVADLAVALLICFSRDMVAGHAHVASGAWSRGEPFPLNRKASGRRVGIMGMGRIGRDIADRLAAFKMEVHYHARSPKNAPADWTYHADPVSLARACDDMVVALVGGAATRDYVSAEVLDALGPDGVVVNISRGTTIDEAALLDRLEDGRLRGAALDVFLNEPKLDPRFLSLSNVLLQPHQGSGTVETRQAMGQLQRDNVAAFFAGKPLLTQVA